MDKSNKGTVVYTVGLPGSGKSTWAKDYVEKLKNEGKKAVSIELDDMRIEMGLPPGDSDSDKFNELIMKRQSRINSYLSQGYTVILPDTNLSSKSQRYIEQLSKQKNVSEVIRKDFTNVSLNVCIERDLNRQLKGERYVGKDTILRMYQLIRPDDPIKTYDECLVVGDVHGDYKRLIQILESVGITQSGGEWFNPNDVFVILLGDLNDPRLDCEESNRNDMSSYKALCIAKDLFDKGWSVTLQSNHGFLLVGGWLGKYKGNKNVMNYTLEELDMLSKEELDELMDWLNKLPFFYSFYTQDKKVTCVHAQYTEGMSQYHPDGKSTQRVLYGDSTDNKDEDGHIIRRDWWNEDSYVPENEIYIAGHYHKFLSVPDWDNPRAMLLDAECGCDNGQLAGFYFSRSGNRTIIV